MKKGGLLLLLGMLAFNAAFGCESPFDGVKGMTCEIECILCADRNIDIKFCDEVKEKFELYKEDAAIAQEKCSKAQRAAKELEIKAKALEKELDIHDKNYNINFYKVTKLIAEANDLRKVARDAAEVSSAVLVNFLGEESLMLLQNEEFYNEVYKVLGE